MSKPDLLFELRDGRKFLVAALTRQQAESIFSFDPKPGEKRSGRGLLEQVHEQAKILLRSAKWLSTPEPDARHAARQNFFPVEPAPISELAESLTFQEAVEVLQAAVAHFSDIDPNAMLKLQRFLASLPPAE